LARGRKRAAVTGEAHGDDPSLVGLDRPAYGAPVARGPQEHPSIDLTYGDEPAAGRERDRSRDVVGGQACDQAAGVRVADLRDGSRSAERCTVTVRPCRPGDNRRLPGFYRR